MRDDVKSKAELLQELETLRRRVAELKQGKDVTERKQAEEELRAFEERFSSLAERSFDLIFMTDAQGYLTYVSAASEKILHYKPQEMVGTHFKNYLIKAEIPRVSQRFAENMKGRNLGIFPMEAMRKDGSHVFIELNSSPIVKDGETIGIQGIIRDITERKRAEEALEVERGRLYSLLDALPAFVYLQAPDYSVRFANRYFREHFGEPEGKPCYEVLWGAKEPCKLCPTFKVFETNKPQVWEWSQSPDGRIYEIWDYPFADVDGSPLVLELGVDITERKKAEEALRESEERYKALFQGAAEGIMVADVETKDFKYANPAICKMLGYTEEELEQMGVRDIHPKEDLQHVISEFEAQARGEKTLSSSIPCLRKDGTIMYADINKAMVLIGGRQCNVGFFTDVTERKKAEEALRESEDKYRTLVENLPQKIFLKDRNSVYVSCNENLARDFKIKSEEIAGKTDYDLLPKELAEKYRADDKRIIESGETEAIVEKYIQEGKERIIHTVKTPVKDEQGNVIGVLGIFWDITELKQTEEELSKYREKIAHAERLASLGTLSATIAHRLNSPLTAIRLSIENSLAELETTSCPDIVTEDLKVGISGVSEVVSIVDSFRDFAKKSSEKIVSQVDLKVVAERIVKLLNESARRAKVSLHFKGMEKLPTIYSNEKDLEQLFFALVENAIQAADGKKSRQLIIDGDVKDKQIELRFADNCGGITPGNLDKIFEPFFTTRPAGEGTGLGLCVVEHIVLRAGGKVRVASKAGEGSTFFVTLPINKGWRS